MKKLLALFLTGVMAFGMIACGNTEPEKDTMPENMASMVAPIDSLARCMLENHKEYDPQDPEFVWASLFYFTGGYGQDYTTIGIPEDSYEMVVISPAMEEHAAALFADFGELPELPSIMDGNIRYVPEEDIYYVTAGDIGMSETRLTSYEKTEDGYKLTAELWGIGEEEELIQAYDVTLVDNPAAEDYPAPLYYYSVADISFAETENAGSETVTETAVFNGLADSHTVELTLPDGAVQAFQFDADSDIAKVIASLKEGDGVTISYTETANGSMNLVSID